MRSLVFLDTETTGLSGSYDRIIEIYMLKVEEDGEVFEYYTFIDPERSIPAKITQITGITDKDVQGAPKEREVAAEIREFIGDGTTVAHNLPFDKRFLDGLFNRNGLAPLKTPGFDTLAISRELFPRLCIYPEGGGSHKLKNLMYHFGLEKHFANSHRAKDDVLLLVQVYRHLEQFALNQNRYQFPRAVTHGCPACGGAMLVYQRGLERELICSKTDTCAQRLVV